MEEPTQIQEPTIKEELKKFNLLENTTIIYALLTFLGYSYIDSYYGFWSINIYSFLDVSEILLSFLNNINYFILLMIMCFTTIIFITLITPPIKYINKFGGIIYPANATKNNLKRNFILCEIAVCLIFLGLMYLHYLYFKNDDIVILTIILFTIFIISFLMLNQFIPYIINKFRIKIKLRYFTYAIFIICLYTSNILFADYSSASVRTKRNETKFNFTYESNNYKSNDTLLFIGATSKYIFIRNNKDSTNLIFDKSNIKNLSITEKRNTNK